jgi:DNA-binding response OmpR family regulator
VIASVGHARARVIPTVLVVEDDEGISFLLEVALEEAGFRVLTAPTGEAGLLAAAEQDLAAALVDLRLPGIQGWELVPTLRANSGIPIIVMTAQTAGEDLINGLSRGADDMLTKPFSNHDLINRLRAQCSTPVGSPQGSVGPLALNPQTRQVLSGGVSLQLTSVEFRLLEYFILVGDRIASRDELLRNVWGYAGPGDARVVDHMVNRLRSKIEIDPRDPQLLFTIPGLGYLLRAEPDRATSVAAWG